MGQIGSYIRRKEDCAKQSEDDGTRHRISRSKKTNLLSPTGICDIFHARIPDALLVHDTKRYIKLFIF